MKIQLIFTCSLILLNINIINVWQTFDLSTCTLNFLKTVLIKISMKILSSTFLLLLISDWDVDQQVDVNDTTLCRNPYWTPSGGSDWWYTALVSSLVYIAVNCCLRECKVTYRSNYDRPLRTSPTSNSHYTVRSYMVNWI